MGASEIAIGFSWIASTLNASPDLKAIVVGGLKRSYAPPGTIPPWIIMGYLSGTDITTSNRNRLFADLLYQVKVVGPASKMSDLINAATIMDGLIGGSTSGTTTNGYILSCSRETPVLMDELVQGDLWTNTGGLYRLQIQYL